MSQENYNNFYKKHGGNVHTDPIRFDAIANLCSGKVLDIACGTGDLADFYKGDYTGLDISNIGLDLAKKMRRSSAKFLVKDATAKTLDVYGKFDTIVIAEFLEHLPDDKNLFANLKLLSNENSKWIVSVPNGNKVLDKNHIRQFTVPELRKKFKEFGKVEFHNYEGFRERILLTVNLHKENENLISLVMPVKNEGKGLEKAILSCINFVDNIVISVDTNSQDNTLQIAKQYADTLKQYKWENSFSKARNFAQEGVKTKWILALDGHEYVEQPGNIRRILNSEKDGVLIKVILESGFHFYYPRIIKANIKWTKEVHNLPLCKDTGKYKKFVIIHDRETGQSKNAAEIRLKQREKMLAEILGKSIKKNRKDYRSIFYLGQLYGSQDKLKPAIKLFKKYLKFSRNRQERWLVYYEIGKIQNILNQPKRAVKSFEKAQKELPDRWEIKKRIGTTYMILKKWEKAADYLVNAFNIIKTDFIYNPEQRNDAQTWFFISQCFFALKKYREAKIALKRAERSQTNTKWGKLPKEQIKIIKELTE